MALHLIRFLIAAALLLATLPACSGGGSGGGGGGGGGEEAGEAAAPGPRLVFLSSAVYSGDLGGTAGADEECQALADAADLEGEFMAWLSDEDSSPALDFEPSDGPYELVDGTRIAEDWDDLVDGTLANPIDLDENGDPGPLSDRFCGGVETLVLTGTRDNGTRSGTDCSGWTSNLGGGTWGRSDQTANWSLACSGGANQDRCGSFAPIFCFQQ